MSDRADAQRRARQIRAFRDELKTLAREGVTPLTAEQRDAVAAHHARILQALTREYDVDQSDEARQFSRGMQLASFFAAVTLTAAIYSLVARFWGHLALPIQASLLCAFPLMALVAVELSALRERTLYVASVFALVAYGTYWLAVVVLSGLLNIPVTPLALWGGALFGLALALPYGFRLILGLALFALVVAFAGSVFDFAGVPWTQAGEHLDIAMGVALLLGAAAAPPLRSLHPSFGAVTRLVGFGVGLSAMLLMSSVGRLSLLTSAPRVSELVYQGAMLGVGLALLYLSVRRRWQETTYLTAALLSLFLFVRFVDWFWDAVPQYLFFFLLAAVAFAWLLALRRLRARLKTEAT